MAGTPPGLVEWQSDTTTWAYSGEFNSQTAPNTYTPLENGGIMEQIIALKGIVNPFDAAVAFDPYSISEPLYRLILFMKEIEDDIRSDMAMKQILQGKLTISRDGITVLPNTTWPTYYTTAKTKIDIDVPAIDWSADYDTVKAKLDATYGTTYINDAIAAFTAQQNTIFIARTARLNARFSDRNAINTSARANAVLMEEIQLARDVADFSAKLNVEMETARINNNVSAANALSAMKSDQAKSKASLMSDSANKMLAVEMEGYSLNLRLEELFDKRGIFFGQQLSGMINAIDLYIRSQRAYVSDLIQVRSEATLWDVKTYDYILKAIAASGGATIVPEKPNQFMESVSTGLSVITSLGPLFAMLK